MTACPHCGHIAPVVLRSWETWIAAKVESANSRSVNAGAARWGYAKKRDEWRLRWRATLWLDGKRGGLPPVWPWTNVGRIRYVTFTRHFTGREREMDHANLIGGMKGPVDAMVRVGLLVDDSPKWFTAEYLQVRSDRSGLHVRIEERAE
jgi:hypothetical protein